MKAQFEALVFDMDGLLIDSEPVYRLVWQEAARRCGFELPDDMHARLIGRGRKASLAFLAEVLGERFPARDFPRVLEEMDQKIFSETALQPKRGAVELLEWCQAASMRCAVATSTATAKAVQRLQRTLPRNFFEVTVGGDQVTHGKPDPEIFLKAAEMMGVRPQACIVFEDSPAGIEGASRAGMASCLVPDVVQPSPEIRKLATYVCVDLYDALQTVFSHDQA